MLVSKEDIFVKILRKAISEHLDKFCLLIFKILQILSFMNVNIFFLTVTFSIAKSDFTKIYINNLFLFSTSIKHQNITQR